MTHLIQRVELFCKGGKVIRQLNVRVFLQNQNQIYPKTVATYLPSSAHPEIGEHS
jgi:hypothetical protein